MEISLAPHKGIPNPLIRRRKFSSSPSLFRRHAGQEPKTPPQEARGPAAKSPPPGRKRRPRPRRTAPPASTSQARIATASTCLVGGTERHEARRMRDRGACHPLRTWRTSSGSEIIHVFMPVVRNPRPYRRRLQKRSTQTALVHTSLRFPEEAVQQIRFFVQRRLLLLLRRPPSVQR